jgi:hypothetical protein
MHRAAVLKVETALLRCFVTTWCALFAVAARVPTLPI